MSVTINKYYKQSKITDTSEVHKKELEQPDDKSLSKQLEVLKQFDIDSTFGPCIGVTRMERWERAHQYGLNPPKEIFTILESHRDNKIYQQNLWAKYDLQ